MYGIAGFVIQLIQQSKIKELIDNKLQQWVKKMVKCLYVGIPIIVIFQIFTEPPILTWMLYFQMQQQLKSQEERYLL